MDRFQGEKKQSVAELRAAVATPLTDSSRFTITALDVGSVAVRPGLMRQIEQERYMLLSAAKLVLGRLRAGNVGVGAAHEYALEAAIKLAELPK